MPLHQRPFKLCSLINQNRTHLDLLRAGHWAGSFSIALTGMSELVAMTVRSIRRSIGEKERTEHPDLILMDHVIPYRNELDPAEQFWRGDIAAVAAESVGAEENQEEPLRRVPQVLPASLPRCRPGAARLRRLCHRSHWCWVSG
jgi:hypothetical protein